jgi:hypothetical protein
VEERLTATGEKVYIKNLKDLTINTVNGGTVSIEASGDITSGTAAGGGNDNNIVADQLALKATGSIGSGNNRLSTDTDQITADSKDLYWRTIPENYKLMVSKYLIRQISNCQQCRRWRMEERGG